ncbi:unnamed protein product [Chrysodeixis includens]|uniref:Uncharacterized protein n=1 Tax=Chrysodeixis includens TaxID=689277 RepID=A0A9P0BYQ9_CHRIL|nr:unnamed protein product [Chrysodeixis includens]
MDDHSDDNKIMEILKDTHLTSRDECARTAVVIRWVVDQAHSCGVNGQQLLRDLLVLGVPRTHASALADAVDQFKTEPQEHQGFFFDRLTDIHVSEGPSGTVDTYSVALESHNPHTKENGRQEALIEKTKAMDLLQELKKAYIKMQELDSDKK